MRGIAIALSLALVITGCARPGPNEVAREAGLSPTTAVEPSEQARSVEAEVVDYAPCRVALSAIRDWSADLVTLAAAYSSVVELSGPGLLDLNFQEPGASQANSDMFEAIQVLLRKAGPSEEAAALALDRAKSCRNSQAYTALSQTCQSALDLAVNPDRSRLDAWVGTLVAFLDAHVDAALASASNAYRVPPREREAFQGAERVATAALRLMSLEAAEANRLAARCRLPA